MNKETPATQEPQEKRYPRARKFARLIKKGRNGHVKFLKASPIPFAWFSTFVAINAVIFGTIEGFTGSTALGITPDLRWAAIWYLWAYGSVIPHYQLPF